jgi:ElaB/YqjD/DUF883 family membrane-anchored ribosome-binding protein
MEGTRESLSDKLETLEEKVVDKVEQATETAAKTVGNVAETVEETVEAVKNTFDLKWHAEHHPWLLVGGAVAVGFLGHCLLVPSRRSPRENGREPPQRRPAPPPPKAKEKDEEKEDQSGFFGQIGEGINSLKNVAVGTALGVLKQVVSSAVTGGLR